MNPLKQPIPEFEREIKRLKQKRARLDRYISNFEKEVERRKALPD
jgi:hypothetical protein